MRLLLGIVPRRRYDASLAEEDAPVYAFLPSGPRHYAYASGRDIVIDWGARRGCGGAGRNRAKCVLMLGCWQREGMPKRNRAALSGGGRDRGGSEQSALL
jgi:hypothetical protein